MKEKYKEYEAAAIAENAERRQGLANETDGKRRRAKELLQDVREWNISVALVARWRCFKEFHPKAAELIGQFMNFLAFSLSVTLWQYLVMLFLPYAFGNLAGVPFVWPEIVLWRWADGSEAIFGIFNEPVLYDALGNVRIGGGLGNLIAFEIAVFTAQCINFPLQRNVTFKSHGNPYYQGLWYFIGWVLISLFTNALWGFINVFCIHWALPNALTAFLKNCVTSTVSMIVFFFVFKIIFTDSKKENDINI